MVEVCVGDLVCFEEKELGLKITEKVASVDRIKGVVTLALDPLSDTYAESHGFDLFSTCDGTTILEVYDFTKLTILKKAEERG